jgi:hypothetical protein
MTHSVFIQANWKFINKWSRIWSPDNHGDLASGLAIYLDKHWRKFSLIKTDEEKIKFIQSWMRNQVKWSNTDYNKDIRVNNYDEEWDRADDYHGERWMDIEAESMPGDLKGYLQDLTEHFGERDCYKLVAIKKRYLTLPQHQKVLYNLYFTEMNSMRDIAAKLKIPLSAVHVMIGELKNKLRDGLDD